MDTTDIQANRKVRKLVIYSPWYLERKKKRKEEREKKRHVHTDIMQGSCIMEERNYISDIIFQSSKNKKEPAIHVESIILFHYGILLFCRTLLDLAILPQYCTKH